ncbi:hypothetical protein Syun_006578 [Stephania yunnanensis]|uniref:Pentatricopeptide repeat-containing protein n=1 Tax=Stephania yunnanensis TaxID=152371 RepID=A0AAP0PXP4_9MAGN
METKAAHLANLLQTCIDHKAHLAGKLIHSQILRNGFFSDIYLSNRLIELYSKCGSLGSARKAFDKMPKRNIYSWNAIVGAYCKVGSLEDAYDLFVEMPERTVVSWNTVIGALAKNGHEGRAVDLYKTMIWEGFEPTHFTFASVLSAYGSLGNVRRGRICHGLVVKVGLDSNLYVGNAIVGMYVKNGSVRDAIRGFGELSEPNEVSFTTIIDGLEQTDQVPDALNMFSKMHRNGIRIDAVAFSSIVGVCARGNFGELGSSDECQRVSSYRFGLQAHGLATKLGVEPDLHFCNSLLDMYAKHGKMDLAEIVFANLPEVSVVSWNILIAGYGQEGQGEKALELLQWMYLQGFEPDEVTFVGMLGASIKCGDIETARRMFDKISAPSVSSWNAMLSGYSQKGNDGVAIELFRKMQFQCVRPDQNTIPVILNSCAGIRLLKCGKQVHAASIRESLHRDVFVASGLVDMYSKCGDLHKAKLIFDRIPERDIVCWNSMISGLTFHSHDWDAIALFKQMLEKGMGPTQFTYASIGSSCATLGALSLGKQIHAHLVKSGYTNEVYVGTALIDLYSKCGNADEAQQFFDGMNVKNVVSWNEMIHGSAQNGRGDKAVEFFEEMIRSGVKPDGITFTVVLTACSHSGLVDEGMRIFKSMEQQHMVQPMAEHYTCIIDTLGRAGRFDEAEMLIDNMPYQDEPILWEVLLSACRVHANVNLGRRAAEQLFRLDPHNPSPYVLLSNIYAALERWDDASAVRKLMSGKGVVKHPAYSWTEYKDGVQAFMVDEDLTWIESSSH